VLSGSSRILNSFCRLRTPILLNGSAAARRSFEAAPKDITSEYTTEWMESQVDTMNKLAEVYLVE
jgi:hypothetical protein